MLEIMKEMKNARKEGPPEKIRYSTTNKVKVIRNEGKFKVGESTRKKKKKKKSRGINLIDSQPNDVCFESSIVAKILSHSLCFALKFYQNSSREFIVPFLCIINNGDP